MQETPCQLNSFLEKERYEAFEFGGFNFARESLSLLDNIDRAVISFKTDEKLKNNKDLNKIIDGIDVIFHLAAEARIQPSFEDPLYTCENNTYGTAIVCEYARKNDCMVNTCSCRCIIFCCRNFPPDLV